MESASSGGRISPWRGALALAAVILLWSAFALTMRGLGFSSLTPVDAALLRFGTPLLVLAPWLPRAVREVRRERVTVIALLAAGGLPHFLLSVLGGRLTSAALVGIILPGTVPLFVALLLLLGRRERLSTARVAALSAIVVGVIATALLTPSSAAAGGVAVLLAGGAAWAVYSIGLRETRLSLPSVVIAVCAPASAAALVLALTGVLPSHLLTGEALARDIGIVAILQGVGTGVVSTAAYAFAIRALGSGTAATWGALSPVVTVVAAIPLFGEGVTLAVVAALVLIVGGVVAFHSGTRGPGAALRRPERLRRAGRMTSAGVHARTPLPQ